MMFKRLRQAVEPEVRLKFDFGGGVGSEKTDMEERVNSARKDWERRSKIAVEEMEAKTPKFAVKQEAVSGEFYVVKMIVCANNAIDAIQYGYALLGSKNLIEMYGRDAPASVSERFLLDRNNETAFFKTKSAALAALERWADPEVIEYDHPPLVERKKENNQ